MRLSVSDLKKGSKNTMVLIFLIKYIVILILKEIYLKIINCIISKKFCTVK